MRKSAKSGSEAATLMGLLTCMIGVAMAAGFSVRTGEARASHRRSRRTSLKLTGSYAADGWTRRHRRARKKTRHTKPLPP